MVAFAFVFITGIILGPMLLIVMVIDFIKISRRWNVRARGFEVIPLAEPVKKP
jgi:hypothetical protein